MRKSKIFAGMTAVAMAASIMATVNVSASNEVFTKVDIDSAIYTITSDSVGTFYNTYAESYETVSAEIAAGTDIYDLSPSSTATGFANLGYIEGDSITVNVDKLTLNGYEFTDETITKDLTTTEQWQNGLPNIWGTEMQITSDDGNAYLDISSTEIALYVKEETCLSSTVDDTSSEGEIAAEPTVVDFEDTNLDDWDKSLFLTADDLFGIGVGSVVTINYTVGSEEYQLLKVMDTGWDTIVGLDTNEYECIDIAADSMSYTFTVTEDNVAAVKGGLVLSGYNLTLTSLSYTTAANSDAETASVYCIGFNIQFGHFYGGTYSATVNGSSVLGMSVDEDGYCECTGESVDSQTMWVVNDWSATVSNTFAEDVYIADGTYDKTNPGWNGMWVQCYVSDLSDLEITFEIDAEDGVWKDMDPSEEGFEGWQVLAPMLDGVDPFICTDAAEGTTQPAQKSFTYTIPLSAEYLEEAFTSRDRNPLIVEEDAPGGSVADEPSPDEPDVPTVTEDCEVSLDYVDDDANHQVYLMGFEEDDTDGPFNGRAGELAQYVGVTYVVNIDENALAEALAPVYDEETGELLYNEDGSVATESWVCGGFGANSDSTAWTDLLDWSIYLDENGEVVYENIEKLEDGVYAITYTAKDGTGIFSAEDTYARFWMADWSGVKSVTGVAGVTLHAPDQENVTVTCPCGCECTEDTCDVWDADLGRCGCGCIPEFVAFEMFVDSTWSGWGNWASTTIPNSNGDFGNGTDAVITAYETSYEVSISAEQVANWYDADGNAVDAGTEGALPVAAFGVNFWVVDIIGLADAIGASSDYYDFEGTQDEIVTAKMQLAKDAGLEVSNVVVSYDGMEVAIPDDRLLYGDIEGNGNIRIEIFNPYSQTGNEDSYYFVQDIAALATDLEAIDTISVTFDITGIPEAKECTCCSEEKIAEETTVSVNLLGSDDMSGASLIIFDNDGNPIEATYDGKGIYSFANLEYGEYMMSVSKENYAPRVYTLSVNGEPATLETELKLYGDINGDGKISILDIVKANAAVKETSSLDEYDSMVADVNSDGKLSIVDVVKMNAHMKGKSLLW